MVINGVDVSSLQGSVDFGWLKNRGMSFAICRNFIGNDYGDSMCSTNLQKAKDTGLYTGIYNFCYILPTAPGHQNRDPEGQAALHFEKTPKNELVCVDLEWPSPDTWKKWGVDAAFIDDWVFRYLEKYKQLSGLSTKQIVLYTYPFWAQAVNFRKEIGEYPLWYANYSNSPMVKPWSDWILEQTSGGNKLTLPNGSSCDVDVAKDVSLWVPIQEPATSQPVIPTINTQPETPPVQNSPSPTTIVPAQLPSNNTTTIIQKIISVFQQLPMQQILNALIPIVKKLFHIR